MSDIKTPQNSFKLLEPIYEERFKLPEMEAIERRLNRQQQTLHFAGDVIDLFMPKVFKTILSLLGSEDEVKAAASHPSMGAKAPRDLPKSPGER